MLQLMHSFRGLSAPQEILDGIREGLISSICLFAFNVESPAQLKDLTDSLYHAAEIGQQPPPIIGIDQEGGQLIAIVNGATELPGNMALGATRSPELAEKVGRVLGRELLAMGINLNFAPSLDVNTNPRNPVIGIRSFGEDPHLVGQLGTALIQGMQAEGVMAAAKHFPGHGDTAADTHWETPTLTHSLERTQAIELYPFREAIAGGSQAVLTAHVLFEALDPNNPATISSAILTQLLRQEMGFAGLTITDAMDMYAVARLGAVPSIRAAINAGADVIMMGHLPDQFTMHAQVQDIQNTASVERIQAARRRIPRQRPPLGSVGNQAHQAIAQEIADKSITLVRGENLPLKISPEAMIAVITPHPEDLTPADTSSKVRISLPDAIRRRHPLVQHIEMSFNAPENQLTRILQATESADVVIMGTIAADVDASQANLVREIYARGQNPVVVALRTPYDLSAFPMIQNYLCAYSIRPVSMEATARVLFGEIEAQGVLPCAIPGITVLG